MLIGSEGATPNPNSAGVDVMQEPSPQAQAQTRFRFRPPTPTPNPNRLQDHALDDLIPNISRVSAPHLPRISTISQDHALDEIDVVTIHVWPQNWGWYEPTPAAASTESLLAAVAKATRER